MRVQVHLHLPALMVMHHYDCIMPERVCLHNLTDALFVGAHAAADKGDCTGRDIIAAFQTSVSVNTQNGSHTQMTVTQFDDIRLRSALRRVHAADDMPARSSDTLVTREVEVHQRIMDILRHYAGVVIGGKQPHHRPEQDAAYQIRTAHLPKHLLLIGFVPLYVGIRHRIQIVGQTLVSQRP